MVSLSSAGIELGHVFKLGTKYTEALKVQLLNTEGKQQPPIMGCYGIGISRVVSAIVEQNHDQRGIVWPASVAPFQVHLITISVQDHKQNDYSQQLYRRLLDIGVEVLWDDREERPGVKFNDADLIGIPLRLIIGKHVEQGMIEYKERTSNDSTVIQLEEVLESVARYVKANQ